MRFGIRDDGIPSVGFNRETCVHCGEKIWVPNGLEGDPTCLNHWSGPIPELLHLIVHTK